MEPSTLLIALAVLACPIGMGLMMWMMNRQMSGHEGHAMPDHPASNTGRLQALQEQRRRLEQEIAEVEKIAALEAQKAALARGAAQEAPGPTASRPAPRTN